MASVLLGYHTFQTHKFLHFLDYCQIIDYALKRLILGNALLKKSVVLLFGICHITNIRLYKKNNAVSFTISILKLAVVVRLVNR